MPARASWRGVLDGEMDERLLGERLGQIGESLRGVDKRLDSIDAKLTDHMNKEESRLRRMEEQISLGKYLVMTAKAIGIVLLAIVTFKFGDLTKGFWDHIGK